MISVLIQYVMYQSDAIYFRIDDADLFAGNNACRTSQPQGQYKEMGSAVPNWAIILQALLVPTVAVLGVMIAFLQWRTAHQKVVLDLFDRRLRIHNSIKSIVYDFCIKTEKFDYEFDILKLRQLSNEAIFLFDKDVNNKINEIFNIIDKNKYHRMLGIHNNALSIDDNLEYFEKEIAKEVDEITKWDLEFSRSCLPYLKMHDKRIPTSTEWLRERNRIRLSYADDKQRQ